MKLVNDIKDSGVADMAFGAVGGVNPVLGNIFAGMKNAQAVKAKKDEIAGYESGINDWFNQAYNENYLDTNAGKAALEAAKEQILQSNRAAEHTAAVTGGSTEAEIAAKTKNTQAFSDLARQLSAMGTARQDRIEGRHQAIQSNILQHKLGLHDADISAAQTMQENSGNQMKGLTDLASFLTTGGLM